MAHECIFILNSIFFIFLVCNGQSYGGNSYPAVLNAGHNIFENVGNRSYVFEQIDSLQDTITSNYPFLSSTHFNLENSLLLFGIRRSTLAACFDSSGSETMKENHRTCQESLAKHLPAIENFISQINLINNYLYNIDSQYQDLKKDISSTGSKILLYQDLPEKLYEFISEICSNLSTCFFHEIAGNHFTQIGGTRPISTTCSVSGEVYHAYLIITLHFLKGYITEIYHYDDRLSLSLKVKGIETVREKFFIYTYDIARKTLSALRIAPRDITLGELSAGDTHRGSSYIQLKWFIDQIIVNEANLNFKGTCEFECKDYNDFTFFYDHGFVPRGGKAICSGAIWKCNHQPLGYLCPANDGSRRYAGVDTREGPLGYANCDDNTGIHTDYLYYIKSVYPHRCDVCTCLCDDFHNPETIRIFSLREVTSNIAENMVITGLRLREINGIIYIQIQQGKLVNMNLVKSVRWVPVNTFDRTHDSVLPTDYWTLYYHIQNTVNLDTLSTQDELVRQHIKKNDPDFHIRLIRPYFLTGVTFRGTRQHLHFGIRLTAWDSMTRKLVVKKWNNWIFNEESTTFRKEIRMENPYIPTKTQDNVEFEGTSYVKFEPSDNVKDFGQTTVPFLDARDVVTQPPMPLSGAGLFYRGKLGYGGFIGLKLISVDFSQLIVSQG